MRETFFTYCANCGKQVLIESPVSICYWCHRNASKKDGKEAPQADNTSLQKVRQLVPKPIDFYSISVIMVIEGKKRSK